METDRVVPGKANLFEPVRDAYGTRLALVFGNEFKDGKCPFYGKQCYHCDIGAGEGVQFDSKTNERRLDFFRRHYRDILPDVAHLVVYNSGSTLNPREMSRETLDCVTKFASSLEKCKKVSFDSREMYVTQSALDFLVSNLREDQQARVILGIETQDDNVRMSVLNKRMSKEGIERAFRNVGEYSGNIGMDVNIVLQPPTVRGEDSVEEAVRTTEYALRLGRKYGVPVDFNIHPYYPSEIGLRKFPGHERATIEDTTKAIIEMKNVIDRESPESVLFVGLYDEGHDQDQEKRRMELEDMRK